jgi:hypothetical protein
MSELQLLSGGGFGKTEDAHCDELPPRPNYQRIQGQYSLWEPYTTRKKHDPFCEKQPERD